MKVTKPFEKFAVNMHTEGHDGQGELPSNIVGFAYIV